jgi:DNA integrity scanning protein DisA with diadenylate cyclase activity
MPSSPLHDGAVVVQQGRLSLAGCFLPLSRGLDLTKDVGTRHRAAVGLTELADAVVIVVSEETGNISVAVNGGMTRNLDAASLKKVLGRLMEPRRVKHKKKSQQRKG